jgi:hypothetical protein
MWSELSEEYFVFQLPPADALPPASTLLAKHSSWLAGLVRLEPGPLSPDEIQEALRLHLCYSPTDLFLPDWAAAVLVDSDCDETLQTIEFANLQLLEYRHIDGRLDNRMGEAYGLIHPLAKSRWPTWRMHARPLRDLGELRIEANSVFERTADALKLVGDQYLSRVYRMLSTRFHLEEWGLSIRHSLDALERVYQVLSDHAAKYRTELLELIIILLIAFEIVMAFVR